MASFSEALKAGLKMSSKPPVVDYQESFRSVHNWRVERDVAKELDEQIKKYDLQLLLAMVTAA